MPVVHANPIRDILDEAALSTDLADFLRAADGSLGVLDGIFYTDYAVALRPNGLAVNVGLVFPQELSISLPGVDGLALVIGAGAAGATVIRTALLATDDDFELRLEDVQIALRFPPEVLRPVGPSATPYVEIATSATVVLDRNLGLRVEVTQALSLPECEIADSGVSVSAQRVSWNFERGQTLPAAIAAGLTGEFLGLALEQTVVRLPAEIANGPTLSFDYCCIGTGGLTAGLAVTFAQPPSCDIAGFTVELQSVAVRFQASRLVAGEIAAVLRNLPFFDADVALDIQLAAGELRIALSAAPDRQTDPDAAVANGLLTLRRPGLIEMTLTSAQLTVGPGGGAIRLSGTMTPLVTLPGGGRLPGFAVEALTITSGGDVSVEGGWISLPNALRASLGPFALELTKVGLGSAPGGERWVAFSGGLALSEGIPLSAAVDGLKVRWNAAGLIGVELAGIAVSLRVEGVLRLEGSVHYDEVGDRLDGAGTLQLVALNLTVSVRIVIGRRAGYNFFYLYLFVAPPVGIPIFSTGLAFYGFEGLYARNMAPDKGRNERWYEDWYRRPAVGAVDTAKWADVRGGQAFGVGALLGTFPDKGYALSVKGLLLVVVPGPVLLVEARANILSDPTSLFRSDVPALLTLLFVYDGNAGTIELVIAIRYVFPGGGELIDVGGSAEAFFSFSDPRAWHLYLGRRERERRIRARIVTLFEANAYLMLDANSLELGGFIGYDADWSAGPLRLALQAYIEGSALISWRPKQLKGYLHMQGGIALTIFGFGFDLSLSATLSAQAPQPFGLLAALAIHIGLPWPLPDIDVEVELRWETPAPPRVVAPLQSVGATHPLTTATWALVAPNGDGAEPVLPLDARLQLAFERAVNDVARVGDNRVPAPDVTVGDYTLRANLAAVELEVDENGMWVPYASPTGAPRQLYGAWQAQPGDGAQGNRRLLLWARTPYQWMRPLTEATIEQLEEAEALDPCDPLGETTLVDFEDHPNQVLPPFTLLAHRRLGFTPGDHGADIIEVATAAGAHLVGAGLPRPYYRCLALPDQFGFLPISPGSSAPPPTGPPPAQTSALRVDFREEITGVTVLALASGGWSLTAYDAAGLQLAAAQTAQPTNAAFPNLEYRPLQLTLRAAGIRRVEVDCTFAMLVLAVAAHVALTGTQRTERRQAMTQMLARYTSNEPVLDPHRRYRLLVTTTIEGIDTSLEGADVESPVGAAPAIAGSTCAFVEEFVFRTEGPPGDATLSPTAASPDAGAPLDTLEVYVGELLPPRGAPAVYRAYDLRVSFAVDYMTQMYLSNGQTLVIDLRSDAGDTASVACALGPGSEVVLRREEQAWVQTLERSSCGLALSSSLTPHETVLNGRLDAAPLAPRRRYDAVLRGDPLGSTEGARPLAAWSFTTSAFLDFADHFGLPGRVRGAPLLVPDGAAWLAAAAGALAAGDPWEVEGAARAQRRALEVEAFDALLAGADVEHALPEVVEMTALTAGGATRAMLLASPEPFAWDRLQLTMTRRQPLVPALPGAATGCLTALLGLFRPRLPGPPRPSATIVVPQPLRALRDADGTRVLLLALQNGAAAVFPAGSYTLAGTFRRDAGPALPVLTRQGSSAEERASIAWALPAA